MSEFKGVFNLFGYDGDQPIQKKDINMVMRSLGQTPSENDLRDIYELLEREGNKPITFSYFLSLMAYKMQDNDA